MNVGQKVVLCGIKFLKHPAYNSDMARSDVHLVQKLSKTLAAADLEIIDRWK
jgi:hypothetical protein